MDKDNNDASAIFSASLHQGHFRLLGPPSGRGADGGARTRDRGVPTDLRADSQATVPPTPPPLPGTGQCPPQGMGFQAPERNRLAARQGRHVYGSKLAAGVPLARYALSGRRDTSVYLQIEAASTSPENRAKLTLPRSIFNYFAKDLSKG
ncbi:hypothetical protein PoB_003524900 [Plakobranchus ocellatus]|uniref:Uncharacterized protein n=1 Tax=Plakobranchus ocellatus TaxID=259542 RepID=A0AAV4ARI6_9GAST|nr:hypothetical protein PoB_003524900 [Plakobranchus ocellatus]